MMHLLSVFLTLLVLFSLINLSVSQTLDSTEIHVTDDHDIAQPPRIPTTTPGMTTPRERTPPAPTTPSRTRIPRRPLPGRLIRPRVRPGMIRDPDMSRPDMFRDPDFFARRPWMSGRMIGLSLLERRAILNMFRDLLRLRLRSMLTWPSTRWEQKMLRLMVVRDMMMMMDVQADDAAEISDMVEQHESAGDFDDLYELETQDEPETADIETDEMEPETVHELAEHEVEDPTFMEAEFEISQPYGYGGSFGFGGYGGGFGGKKGGKKVPYKKVPYKKVPYKKVPFKKGPPKKKGGFGGFGGGFI